MPRNCVNSADKFCYICGEVTFARQGKATTAIVKKAYHLYFGCKISDQAKSWSRTYHYHHWPDSPWWDLAFFRSFAHSSLSRATFFQFLTSNVLISWSTPSSHRNFGLPTLLTPSGLVSNIFSRVLSLFICIKCPAHANFLLLCNWQCLVH